VFLLLLELILDLLLALLELYLRADVTQQNGQEEVKQHEVADADSTYEVDS
jgi:hypothetical protein